MYLKYKDSKEKKTLMGVGEKICLTKECLLKVPL